MGKSVNQVTKSEDLAPCPGAEFHYGIDRHGGVWRTRTRGGKECLRPIKWLIKHGYASVCLCVDQKKQWRRVHRLAARAFISEPPEGQPTVNHLDGNKLNNNIDNLEWASYSRQMTHAIETGLIPKPVPPVMYGSDHPSSPFTEEDILEIRRLGRDGVSAYELAKSYPVSRQAIAAIINRKTWRHI